jgi:ribosomal protein S18 acetylase RimI-like enzyme
MEVATKVRDAVASDARRIAAIGATAMQAQYEGLVDRVAVEAAVEQSYSIPAVRQCIAECSRAPSAEFLVAERNESVVGYLHFDCMGPEPELHRLYVDAAQRGGGVGAVLMTELHARLENPHYMLLVVAGNDRAVAFYERHGLRVERRVDGLTYYRERMGVSFPEGTRPFELVLMRR